MEYQCESCHFEFAVEPHGKEQPKYCPFCMAPLLPSAQKTMVLGEYRQAEETSSSSSSTQLIKGLKPDEENIQFKIGPYEVIRSIGKGGMGEVLLAYDTLCGRQIALKRIRSDLIDHPQMHNRFLKEARVTSQLTHPAIIPIYTIHNEGHPTYYTMPFVEGNTLKQILKVTRQQEKSGETLDYIGGSIPALIRVFLNVCQAVAYAHNKGVLHRDIKPENIIVGKYGEVLILDWGLAKIMRSDESEDQEFEEAPLLKSHPLHQITHIGRVVGTVSYMAPERGMGAPATIQTDVYSLGVILYQILTLRNPFKRGSLKDFRKKMQHEVLIDPVRVAPYRDIPLILSRIALKCLEKEPENRYRTVDALIHDLENYIEGRSEWFKIAQLNIENKADWEFQENVLIAEHIAITRGIEVSDWVSLMISKQSFLENIKLETKVKIGSKGQGIGFLLNIPEANERTHLNDGYYLWIGSDLSKSTKLLCSTVEVLHAPDIFLRHNEWYTIRIERIDNHIYFYLNDALQFSYTSYLPVIGTHIGVLSRDADFQMTSLFISVGSHNIKVNCLAVPDAFLAHKDYVTALSEYRRIGYSFPGTAEGREAMFRAGVTLLEEGKGTEDKEKKNALFELALDEFSKLHSTPGAPLEYLGKALVYETMGDLEEEIKCFELAIRRYPDHPLLYVLKEQILHQMLESSRYDRIAAYNFILLTIRHLPDIAKGNNVKKLFTSLQNNWEKLYFIESSHPSQALEKYSFGIPLAFWLAKPIPLIEMVEEMSSISPLPITKIANALFCLIELGSKETACQKIEELKNNPSFAKDDDANAHLHWLMLAAEIKKENLEEQAAKILANLPQILEKREIRVLWHLLEYALNLKNTDLIYKVAKRLPDYEMKTEDRLQLNCLIIWAHLLDSQWEMAGSLIHDYSYELISQETTLLHLLYGCWLFVTEGKEIANAHFSGVLDVSYPRSWTLLSHIINGKIVENRGWFLRAFLWEKRQLYRQLVLFYHCIGDKEKMDYYQNLESKQYIDVNLG